MNGHQEIKKGKSLGPTKCAEEKKKETTLFSLNFKDFKVGGVSVSELRVLTISFDSVLAVFSD